MFETPDNLNQFVFPKMVVKLWIPPCGFSIPYQNPILVNGQCSFFFGTTFVLKKKLKMVTENSCSSQNSAVTMIIN